MMWPTTALQIILFSQLARTEPTWPVFSLRYVDYGMTNQDFYFDRIVTLSYNFVGSRMGENYGIGVVISSDRIITSFNPFRIIIRNETLLSELYVVVFNGRIRSENRRWFYTNLKFHLACGRQIQDLPDDEISRGDLWHGMGNRHCPLHDLLVFRIDGNLKESEILTKDHRMENYPNGKYTKITHGVFFTKVAKPFQNMGVEFKFCAVIKQDFLSFDPIHPNRPDRSHLQVTYYEEDDNALLDCNEWLPRDWGYFFCILNKNNYSEVTSGAMLVSNEMLFGVGSFVLFRGAQSIIVFTDVRPYYELIYKTCTFSDSEETPP